MWQLVLQPMWAAKKIRPITGWGAAFANSSRTWQSNIISKKITTIPAIYSLLPSSPKAPQDNNSEEKAIRNIKVKQRISGQFKTPKGPSGFDVSR